MTTIRTADGAEPISVEVTPGDGPWATVTVRDQGIGIPEADLPYIFERFHRARNTEGQIRGTGLGLAGAQQIMAQHGGRIEVASVEGAGSTFTVLLPLLP